MKQLARDRGADGDEARGFLHLVRIRLWLALLTVAVLPIALLMALAGVVLGSEWQSATALLAVIAALTLLIGALTVWMTRQVLLPAEELVRSRAELREMYELARADALHDGLTGLGNHRAFQEELERVVHAYQRYKAPVALLILDLDDLKVVNDSDGHAAGDALLRDMGRLISTATRYSDRAFRIGGDEFAIVMPHTDALSARHAGNRLLEHALLRRGDERPIPFSGGVSACPELATTRAELYAQADAALYWCKRHGRTSIDVYDPARDRAATREATEQLSGQIARVVSERLVRPVYQPIVDLASGRVLGFEGLSRPAAETGFADPAALFAAAETVGRTVELDFACLHAVIGGAREMSADQLLTVNVSPRTIEAPLFSTEALLAILARYGIAPGRVVVEVTERERVEDVSRLQSALRALQRAGVRIAADDVGAGNAGLRLLSQFHFDIVKIDLSLVQAGAQRDSSRAVLGSLRELAGQWGASVIAEGIETAGQLRTVRQMGIPAGQGYLLARPMPSPLLGRIDIDTIEAGGAVLERRPPRPVQPAQLEAVSPFGA
jgi:diguanylate cyclase (GGDEF)-like protein